MRQYLPFLDWISSYTKKQFSGDLSAGLTVGVMLIPQGMAYSMLAGLPPIYGLYASTIPLILYALFGTSRQLAVGPVAMVALLISSGVGAIATQGSSEFITLAILLALMVGIIQLLMGVFRLGFLVNFLSHPVIAGFTSAAALIIGFSQFKHLLGLSIPRGKVHETIISIAQQIGEVNLPTLAIGVGAILIIILIKRWNPRIPAPLIVVALGIGAVYLGDLNQQGVSIVGEVPAGLPGFSIPSFNMDNVGSLLPIALTISFVGFMESIAVAKAIQAKHKNYEVNPNQELIGLGVANIFGSFFKAFPTTGGFSRTAVNDQAGAKTGMASLISAGLIMLTLLFLTEYFYFLPKAILASIIVVAVFGLIDFKEAKHLWKTDRVDFWMFMSTAIATLILGVEEGILTGVALSMGMLIYRVSYPHIAILGKLPNSDQYRNIKRFNNLETDDSILIIRPDAQLYFANAGYVKNWIDKEINNSPNVKHIILNAKAINGIDSSALHMLKDMVSEFRQKNITLNFTGIKGPVRDVLNQSEFVSFLGEDHFFMNVDHAVKFLQGEQLTEPKNHILQAS